MRLKSTPTQWSTPTRVFHWLIAFMIFLAMVLGWAAELWPLSPAQLTIFVWHKVVGITILGLVALRILWRLTDRRPDYPADMKPAHRRMAGLGHGVLYLLLILMPLSGWILNSAANFPFQWFGLFDVPHLVAPDEGLQQLMSGVHLALFWVLLAVILGHAAMAIYHHLAHRNHVLTSMLPGSARPGRFGITFVSVFAAVVLVGYLVVSSEPRAAPDTRSTAWSEASGAEESETASGSAARTDIVWRVDYEQSRLGFTGTYAGVSFQGNFSGYEAQIYFDPAQPNTGYFDVTIDVRTVTTNSSDRDAMIGGGEWFDFAQFPEAYYRTRTITGGENTRFIARGVLDLKGHQNPVDLHFDWQDGDGDGVRVSGTAQLIGQAGLDRRDFAIGSGMWANDGTVGYGVTVEVDLLLNRE